MSETTGNEIVLTGIGGSPGICIGKAYLVDKEGVDVIPRYYIQEQFIQNEVNRFKTAVNKSREELQTIIDKAPEDFRQHTQIIETHIVLLKDKTLYGKSISLIENEGMNAEWALKKVVAAIKPLFESMTDSYLKDRAEDIGHVADRIMKNLMGAERINIGDINKRVILVAKDLSPAETSQIKVDRIQGFVTNRGGKASHTTIIARTLEIPAVLGVENATRIIKDDDIIIVDGSMGTVTIHPTEKTLIRAEDQKHQYENRKASIAMKCLLPAVTMDGMKLSIHGNIEFPEESSSVIQHGGDGIGLFRTEFQYISRRSLPTEDLLYEGYREVIQTMGDRPVTIRTLDINGDKNISLLTENDEANPALGLRGIRYCLKRPEVFKTQLRAILRASHGGNVKILFPMISGIDEIIEAKAVLADAKRSLSREGIPFSEDIPVGIMVEVPSVAVTADLIAEEVDFFSIGTNDLIQYTMAVDRGNRHLAYLYHPLHPAIIRMVKMICDVARQHGIETYMCGEMAGDPLNLPILLALGLKELSLAPQSIPVVKAMIRSLSATESRVFLKEVIRQKTAQDIIRLMEETYGKQVSEMLFSAAGSHC